MKSKRFKLVKEFPLSPKLGTIITFETSGEFSEQDCNTESHYVFYLKDCINYPEFWEEVFPKFKVGDIVFIFSQENSICKLIQEQEWDWLVEFSNGSIELVHKCWSIKEATKDEILQFYKERGWKKDVKFKWDNEIYVHSSFTINKNGEVLVFVEGYNTVNIKYCELLPEQITTNKFISDLSETEKFLLDNNWEFRDEDYGLEFYIELPLDNELIFWDDELTIKNKLTDRAIVVLHKPTINQIENLIKTFKK